MTFSPKLKGLLAFSVLFALAMGCRKDEQAVQNTIQTAVNAEHQAQATATVLDQERAQLSAIPLPTKSMYIDVHDPSQWTNPFLAVGTDYLTLRIVYADANTSTLGQGTLLRPEAARRQELQIHFADLDKAMTAIPADAWHYGRVIAVAESPEAGAQQRPAIRRNVESVIRRLNDLGVVVEEWPTR